MRGLQPGGLVAELPLNKLPRQLSEVTSSFPRPLQALCHCQAQDFVNGAGGSLEGWPRHDRDCALS